MSRRLVAVLAATACLATLAGPVAGTPGADGAGATDATCGPADEVDATGATAIARVDDAGTAAAHDGDLRFAYRFERLPDEPGRVRVRVDATVPASVTSVAVRLPGDANATVVDATGYEPATDDGAAVRRWTRADGPAAPTLVYDVDVDATDDGTVDAADVGDWALFDWRRVDLAWSYRRSADAPAPAVTERAAGAVGAGYVGPAYAYLGPSETYERTVDGETIRLVVPDAADPVADPNAVADALATASAQLRVGGRNERLTVVAAPAPVEAPGRLSRKEVDGRQDAFVAADEPLETADNAWLHEYVHSRQAYETGDGARWLDDGLAEYYAALLAYRGSHVDREAVHEYVRTDRESDAVLAAVDDDVADASYFKGMRVLAALDAEIRATSDGGATLQAVLAAANDHEGTVTRADLATFVADAAGERRDAWLDRYVAGEEAPPVPRSLDRVPARDGGRAFGGVVAEVTGAVPVGQAPFALPPLLAVGFVAYRVVGRS